MAEEGEDEKDEEEEARMLMKVPDRGDIVTRGWALYERAFRRTPRAHVDEPISPEGTTERRRKKGENERRIRMTKRHEDKEEGRTKRRRMRRSRKKRG